MSNKSDITKNERDLILGNLKLYILTLSVYLENLNTDSSSSAYFFLAHLEQLEIEVRGGGGVSSSQLIFLNAFIIDSLGELYSGGIGKRGAYNFILFQSIYESLYPFNLNMGVGQLKECHFQLNSSLSYNQMVEILKDTSKPNKEFVPGSYYFNSTPNFHFDHGESFQHIDYESKHKFILGIVCTSLVIGAAVTAKYYFY
jgi:hypothetical protein